MTDEHERTRFFRRKIGAGVYVLKRGDLEIEIKKTPSRTWTVPGIDREFDRLVAAKVAALREYFD